MNSDSKNKDWKQHFPTYSFSERDVALEEYRFATKILEAEERVFLNAVNLSVVVAAALGSLVLGTLQRIVDALTPSVPLMAALAILVILIYAFSTLSLSYFADRHKAVVFATRKVIVLRRMLGLSYGDLQLVLPNYRIEGADQPFAIRTFPGWKTYAAYPCFVIAGISSVIILFVAATVFNENATLTAKVLNPLPLIIGVAVLWFVRLSWCYRVALMDVHERPLLLVATFIAKLLRVKVVDNFEQVIYRANLATYELSRINVDTQYLKSFAIHIEDKEFESHKGTSLRGLTRLMLSMLGLHRRSGGSTITQQLVRTLFIVDQKKLVRRKIVEIILARWFDGVSSKSKLLDFYLSSVRFETGVFGVAAAIRHYFGANEKSVTPAEAFVLIERLSNIRSRLLVEKINQTMRTAFDVGLLDKSSASQVIDIYKHAVSSGKIKDLTGDGIERLSEMWQFPTHSREPIL
tara:strand:+ start:1357 stop:2748 length:1392 start_codon:yes stop_codon:yes gene_type:complete